MIFHQGHVISTICHATAASTAGRKLHPMGPSILPISRTYTKHGPRSMDHPRGPGPWTTLWACGPGPWTTSWTRSMDHSRGPGPWTTPGPDFHRACSCTIYVGSTVLSTVGLCTLADHNLPMSNEIPTAVGQNVWTTFFFAFECKHQCSALTTH